MAENTENPREILIPPDGRRGGGPPAARRSGRGGRGRGQVPESGTGGSAAWLVTFTDVMALMLTFFVMMFTMAEPEQMRWTGMAESLRQEFTRSQKGLEARPDDETDSLILGTMNYNRGLDLDYLQSILARDLGRKDGDLADFSLSRRENAIVLALPAAMWDAETGRIASGAMPQLYALAENLARLKNRIEIEATGPATATGRRDALIRAAAAAGALGDAGYARDIAVRAKTGRKAAFILITPDDGTRNARARIIFR